jgi:hypothetical protein
MQFPLANRSPIRRQLYGSVEGIGASKTAVITVPVGATYLDLRLFCTIATVAATRAEIEAMITQVRVLLSGRPIMTLTSLQLIAIAEFYRTGIVGDSGYLLIPFERLWQRETGGALNPALGTVGESSLTVEITQASGSTIDDIDVWASISPVAEEVGAYMRYDRFTPALPGAGEYIWSGLKPRPGEFLYALHFLVSTAADLTAISFEADGYRVVDQITQGVLGRLYAEPTSPRTMQTAKKLISLDFACRGFDGDAVPLVMDEALVRLTFANAPTVLSVIAEIGAVKQSAAS